MGTLKAEILRDAGVNAAVTGMDCYISGKGSLIRRHGIGEHMQSGERIIMDILSEMHKPGDSVSRDMIGYYARLAEQKVRHSHEMSRKWIESLPDEVPGGPHPDSRVVIGEVF